MNKDSQSIIKGLVCSCCMISAALLAPAAQADTSTGYVTLYTIHATTDSTAGNIFYAKSTAWPGGEACDSTSYIIIVKTATNYDSLNKMLYEAFFNNRQVNFTLSGCQAVGGTTYPIIRDFTVAPPPS
jgi:hypothetical protein